MCLALSRINQAKLTNHISSRIHFVRIDKMDFFIIFVYENFILKQYMSKLLSIVSLGLIIAGTTSIKAKPLQKDTLDYKIEMSGNAATGTYAPLWLTANRYGLASQEPNSGYLRAGVCYNKSMKHNWRLETGLDLAGAVNQTAPFVVQQAYADISWRMLTLSVGSKERPGFPLEKNAALSSGMMVEGPNARPVPQIRGEIKEYLPIGFTGNWLALKGHLAYGMFTDGNWGSDFVAANQKFYKKMLYHSKSLMLRLGNREKLPLEFEFGLLTIAQFGGDLYQKNADGTTALIKEKAHSFKDFMKIFLPKQDGTIENVQGNHGGSWNFALNYYLNDWKIRAYLEHYFEDHSQMFWQYGRWKDGQLGLEVTFPKNRWVSTIIWEGLATTNQTGPFLYDGIIGSFPEYQISANDNYYNNFEYLGWQHWGMGMGHPLLPGPVYNTDGTLLFESNRVRAQHVGISGDPSEEWSYRLLLSYTRHWGTYNAPLDKVRKQFSSLAEVTYCPQWATGWSGSVSLGLDRGNYLGNSAGGCVTIRKTGRIF